LILPDKNWNKEWESNFKPVRVDKFCLIKSSFHTDLPTAKYIIEINPKQAFGTGHHETTYMMIEQMSEIDFKDKSVADMGTGTGVLAILAEKMGATAVVATEIDSIARENAHENISINSCQNIQIVDAEFNLAPKEFDIVLANINLNTLINMGSIINDILAEKGVVVLSGILNTQLDQVIASYSNYGLVVEEHNTRGDWSLMQLSRNI